MKKSTIFFTIIILLLTLQACEECNECGPDNTYPFFKLTVLNRTSLDTLQANVKRLESEIKALQVAIDSTRNSTEKAAIAAIKNNKSDSLSNFNKIVSIVNSRLVSISEINGVKNLYYSELRDSDSLTSFAIPLNANNNHATYAIQIAGTSKVDSLTVSYELIDTVINDKITKAAKALEVITHNYDSLRGPFGCAQQTHCISNSQTVYVEI